MTNVQPKIQVIPNYVKFLAASLAGVCSTLACYPLDLVKTRMQVHGEGSKEQRISSLNVVKSVVKDEGVLGLYNGLSASILRQVTYTGIRMGCFQTLVDYFTENGKPPNILLKSGCGAFAGALGGIAGTPFDVVLTRMAADGNVSPEKRRNYKHVFNALGRIIEEEGFPVLFRGLNAIIFRSILVNVSQLVSYSQIKETLIKHDIMEDNILCHTVCSIFSGGVVTTTILPADLAKTKLQNMVVINGVPQYKGMLDVWAQTIKNEGVLKLWKGYTPMFLRTGPQTVVVLVSYEYIMYLYKQLFN